MPSVTVMTWNIHGAYRRGRNPGFDLAKVIALVKSHDPDVIALQEIDSRRPRTCNVPDDFRVLQDALGNHGIGAKTIKTADGEYGQALFARWPIEDVEIHDISFREREPRRAIRCEVALPEGRLRVIATHLGLSIGERRGQAKELLRLIGDGQNTTVVLGDFNDWFWVGSVRKVLASRLPGRSRLRTFPSICPMFRFDRIYCRPLAAFISARTDPAAKHLSDHLPVIAKIQCD